MTIIDDAPVDVESDAPRRNDAMSDAQKRDAARDLALRDREISGAELAARYGMKAAWGRDQARIARHGARRGQPAKPPAVTPPTYGPPAPVADAPRRVNGTTHTPAPAPVRPSKPTPPKAAAPAPAAAPAAPSGLTHAVTVLGVIVVAVIAAVISYAHMRHLALEVGEGWRADLLPFSVDGMMVVASMTLLAARREGRGAPLALVALMLGLAASLAANVVAAAPELVDPVLVGRLIAAWPPVALILAFELLLQQGRTNNRKDTQ